MNKMDEKFETILMGALKVFMTYGIRSVTMDDLAKHMGISKKTLYRYVTDKNDLVIKGIEYHQQLEMCALEACVSKNLNAIDENFEISKVIVDQLQNIHPSVMFDLEKYYPEAMATFDQYKKTVVKHWVEDNMRRGIEEGLYRKDLNIPVLTGMYLARINDFFNADLFPKGVSFSDIYLEIFRYHIRGLASEKGVKYLQDKVKKELSN
ncbi:MAG: TetR/AcrR family transcriptional regulator [Flavobacteriales bacterium]|nr:TetR/AcrR family transcriptional regulator [Flavobacteriales bacterium]